MENTNDILEELKLRTDMLDQAEQEMELEPSEKESLFFVRVIAHIRGLMQQTETDRDFIQQYQQQVGALKVERDKLIQAVADHVTVREEQYRRIQALDAQARDHLVQLGAERNRALKAEQERDALRVEIEAHRGRADANGLRSIANAAVNGEMTTSRVCELINIWLAGNFTQDQLPPVRQLPSVPNKAAEDTGPWDVIEHMQDELGRLREQVRVLSETLEKAKKSASAKSCHTCYVTRPDSDHAPCCYCFEPHCDDMGGPFNKWSPDKQTKELIETISAALASVKGEKP